jgi:F0F1-type ATP synthase assembly protein I
VTTEPRNRLAATWILLAGAATGVAVGILVSVATDLPLAPEVGLLLGLGAGWLVRRATT